MRRGSEGAARAWVIAFVGIAGVTLVVVLVASVGGSSSGKSKSAAAETTSTKRTATTLAGADVTTLPGATDTTLIPPPAPAGFVPGGTSADGPPTITNRGRQLPLNISVSSTSGLHDGSPVNIHVTPKPGSVIYAYEIFECKGGVPFAYDADIRPPYTGKCISKPLSPDSDDYLNIVGAPPYQSLDATFRVGVGTDSFALDDGGTATITCDKNNPCQLALKVQYPDDFGFAAYPLTFG